MYVFIYLISDQFMMNNFN